MTLKEFQKLKSYIDKIIKKLEDEALAEGVDTTSQEYERAVLELKKKILAEKAIPFVEYSEIEQTLEDGQDLSESEAIYFPLLAKKSKEKFQQNKDSLEARVRGLQQEFIANLSHVKEESKQNLDALSSTIEEVKQLALKADAKANTIQQVVKTKEVVIEVDKQQVEDLRQELMNVQSYNLDNYDKIRKLREAAKDLLPKDFQEKWNLLTSGQLADALHTHDIKQRRGFGGIDRDTAIKLISQYSSSLPSQTGNNGKFLTTNGTTASWASIPGGGDMLAATYDAANIAEQLVGLTAIQSITNKTFGSGNVWNAGQITATITGSSSATPGTFVVDSSAASQPALIAKNATNFAHAGNIGLFQALNATDSGNTVQIDNHGTGLSLKLTQDNSTAVFGITKDGKVSTGIWNGTKIGLAYGGTNADLSATGGTSQYLKQASAGAAITVGTIPASDIASGAALTKTNDTNVTLTLGGTPTTALLVAASLTLGWTGTLAVSRGGTGGGSASITLFNNITGYTAAGATGTTSTNLVFSTSPTLTTPVLGVATATSINGLVITSTAGTLTIPNNASAALILSGNFSTTFTATATTNVTLPTTGTLATLAGTEIFSNKTITKRVVTASDATSVTPNSDNADWTYQANTQSTGTLTINADAGTPTNARSWGLKIKSTNVQTFSWNAGFVGGTTALPTATTGGSKIDYFTFIYDTVNSKWHYTGTAAGF